MRALLKGLLAAAVLFAVVLGLTFPTDQVVRQVLSGMPLPEDHAITFQRAHLRPWGLILDGAAYRRNDGQPVVETTWVRLRPSWMSLPSDHLGRPWRVAAGIFDGTVDSSIDANEGAKAVEASWTDIDLGALLGALNRNDPLTGRATGRATLRVPSTGTAAGEGELTFRGATWQPPLDELADVPLHADTATLRWNLGEHRLEIASFALHGEEVEMTARGQVRIAEQLGQSPLDLRVTIEALPGAPVELRRALDGLPRRSDGVHDFRLTGVIDAPQVAPP